MVKPKGTRSSVGGVNNDTGQKMGDNVSNSQILAKLDSMDTRFTSIEEKLDIIDEVTHSLEFAHNEIALLKEEN